MQTSLIAYLKKTQAVTAVLFAVREKTYIYNSNFSGNYASGDGGAVCVKSDTSASFNNSGFSNNRCDGDGGAVALWSHTDANFLNCDIKSNSSGGNGGGVYFGAISDPSTHLKESQFFAKKNKGEYDSKNSAQFVDWHNLVYVAKL